MENRDEYGQNSQGADYQQNQQEQEFQQNYQQNYQQQGYQQNYQQNYQQQGYQQNYQQNYQQQGFQQNQQGPGFQQNYQQNFQQQGFQQNQQQEFQQNYQQPPFQNRRYRKAGVSAERFEIFGGLTFGYAMLYGVFMYKNYSSVCSIFMTILTVLFMSVCIVKHEMNVPSGMETVTYGQLLKKQKKLLPNYIGILLLGISVCRTGDSFLIFMNHVGILFLVCSGLLNYFGNTKQMGYVEYVCAVIEKAAEPLSSADRFFSDYGLYGKVHGNTRKRSVILYILMGLVVAIPLLYIMISLLASADEIFGDAVETILGNIFLSWDALWFLVFLIAVLLYVYGMIVAAPFSRKQNRTRREGKHEPIVAITAMGLLTLVYLMFSVIQILYLFLHNMSLPDDMTYAEYARQGFFQLLFVSIVNVVLVLVCHAIFRKSTVLNIVLTVMSACTYVMLASAALRMGMYIREYDLSYMRILVYAALVVLAFVVAGVMIRIYTDKFPLVRYSVFVVMSVYIIVSFLRPAHMIAEYNLNNQDPSKVDFRYVTSMGADAADEVYAFVKENYPVEVKNGMYKDGQILYSYNDYNYLEDGSGEYEEYNDIEGFTYNRIKWYFQDVKNEYKEKGAIRGFNFSRKKAADYADDFFEEYNVEETE